MQKIPSSYRLNGFDYDLVKRTDHVALYHQHECGYGIGYEVVTIRKHKKDKYIMGKMIGKEGDEYLPGTSEWGSYGWSYNMAQLEHANNKYDEVHDEKSNQQQV